MNIRYCPGVELDVEGECLRVYPRVLARYIGEPTPSLTVRDLADVFVDALVNGTPDETSEYIALAHD
jgi:hypothetical protein